MKLTFLGATQTVTGSKFLLEAAGKRIMIDCGLFQGLKELRLRNWEAPPVVPAAIDALILTHAHIDHTGYTPRFVNQGFRGPIYGTPATVDLLRILLPDSAHLQEEEARFRNRHAMTKHKPALPLYTIEDADAALRLARPVSYRQPFPLAPGLSFDYLPAGHILGSAFVRFQVAEPGRAPKTVLFTGDIGRYGTPIIKDPAPVDETDVLILESTYGNRLHGGPQGVAGKLQLRDAIVRTESRGGQVLIPSFAIGRAQEILYYLRELENERQIPVLPVFIDSPMAVSAFEVFQEHTEEHDLEMKALRRNGGDPLSTRNVQFCRSVEESKAINAHRGPAIIISANGMATGGRVVHHLMRLLPDGRNTVIFVGFQAAGTRGRYLVEGARTIKLYGAEYPARAEIESIDGFSAHGDYNEILRWLEGFKRPPEMTFLVHGEPNAIDSMKRHIEEKHQGWKVRDPEYLEKAEF
ncbi:MAG TPA: MBL fold metallo-hydrolase [Terriglobia bacterium]|nr:MBL fold metallo-hydrolase [Terriglobia bacterium]